MALTQGQSVVKMIIDIAKYKTEESRKQFIIDCLKWELETAEIHKMPIEDVELLKQELSKHS